MKFIKQSVTLDVRDFGDKIYMCVFCPFFGDIITISNKANLYQNYHPIGTVMIGTLIEVVDDSKGLNSECLNSECLNSECLNSECLNSECLNSEGPDSEDQIIVYNLKENEALIHLTKSTGRFVALSSGSNVIAQGETKFIKAYVGAGVKYLDIQVSWTNKRNRLSLAASDPAGKSYGSFYDNSSGEGSGYISVRIYPGNNPYLPKGTWMCTLHGDSISGTEHYTFKAIKYT